MTNGIIKLIGGGVMVAAGLDIYLAPPDNLGPLRVLWVVLVAAGTYLLVAGIRGLLKRKPERS